MIPASGAGTGKFGVLRKETVAGMNGINVFFFGQRDNAFDIEIRGDRTFALADEVSFVRLETMETKAIFLGIDGHGAEPEFGARAEDADRDFAAVGSE